MGVVFFSHNSVKFLFSLNKQVATNKAPNCFEICLGDLIFLGEHNAGTVLVT